ncbi:RNA-directed DNA polymerase, eukaryota, reverse transcriptase zinc-binding domain protein [Tanacetum coccineum]
MNGIVDYARESEILNRHGDVRDEIEIDDQNEERHTGEVVEWECKEDLEGVREEAQGIKVNNDTVSTGMEKHVESVPRNKVGEDRNNKGCDDNGRLDEVNLATRNEEISYTEVDESDNEFVIFDDEMIKEWSKKWQLTLCGYFVGCKMHINELRYNIRRMWSRHGFKDMVNNKPLVIQKWDVNMCVDKTEPDVLPLWVKMCNISLEAWTVNGISALASRIGKPLIMDAVTTSICKLGVGRLGFARVLVEVQAKKGLPDKIDVVNKNAEKVITGVKIVQVKYDWMPFVCSQCSVFGHSEKSCPKNDKKLNVDADKVQKHDEGTNNFVEVTYKKNDQKKVNQIVKPFQNNNLARRLYTKVVYKPVNDKNGKGTVKVNENLNMGTINSNGSSSQEKKGDSCTKEKTVKPIDTYGSKSGSKSIERSNANGIQKTNKYSILSDFEEDDMEEITEMANR